MKTFFIILLASLTLYAQDAFITAIKLDKILDDKNLVLIDTADIKIYNKGHIPHSNQVDISKFRHWVDNTYLLINSPQEIQKIARSLGINQDSHIVLYGHNKGKELLKTSYIALALIVNGAKHVSILNGGYADWDYEFEDMTEKFSTTKDKVKLGNFTANFNPNILVDLEYVKAHIGKVPMIEARPKAFYTGERKSNGVRRLGHISGASSSFWRDKFNVDDSLKNKKSLRKIFIGLNKLNPDKELIAYCTGGLEASMNWYILTQHLGYKDVKLYDASMKEWGNLDSTPMQK
ncbi:sulfurtransferase [Sulfurimonas sp. SAG-AH-194-C21]|nr:rhodanese-like domain-containing protein [Sulfurimonas sp. SAG-AH-194-C21]MDF1883231.1 sulfurtransferase [Sulfurimonas sp. SAG-AH-194-C21]